MTEPGTGFDGVLRSLRRLDWRFCLSDPTLRRVGYIGPRTGRLRESLQQFSDRFTDIDRRGGAIGPTPPDGFDVIVVSEPDAITLRRAVAMLRRRAAPLGALRPDPTH